MTGDATAPVELVLDNGYEEAEHLSVTGSTVTGIVIAGVVLLGLGGAALVLQRRRKQR